MHAVDSVFSMRTEITGALQQLPAQSHANGPLRSSSGARFVADGPWLEGCGDRDIGSADGDRWLREAEGKLAKSAGFPPESNGQCGDW